MNAYFESRFGGGDGSDGGDSSSRGMWAHGEQPPGTRRKSSTVFMLYTFHTIVVGAVHLERRRGLVTTSHMKRLGGR